MNSLSTLGGGGGSWEGCEWMLAIPEHDGRFLHNRSTDFESVTWTSLGPTPATRRYKVRPCRINTHEVAIYSGGGVMGTLSADAGDPRGRWRTSPQPRDRF